MTFTKEQVISFVAGARKEARRASEKFFQEKLNGQDQFACGFEKGNTKLGRALKEAGFEKSYNGGLQLWNPSGMYVQNVDTLEAGAEAAAQYLQQTMGIKAYADSRLD